MKKFTMRLVLFLSILLSSIFTGCKKEDMGNSPVIDKTVFFTIKIEGVNYTTYGYTSKNVSDPYGGPNMSQSFVSTALPTSNIILRASKQYKSVSSGTVQLGNCDLHLALQKDNADMIGDYTRFIGGYSEQTVNLNSAEEIYFDNRGMLLTITRVIHHPGNNAILAEGRFSCLVFKSSNPGVSIPAVGNFVMYVN